MLAGECVASLKNLRYIQDPEVPSKQYRLWAKTNANLQLKGIMKSKCFFFLLLLFFFFVVVLRFEHRASHLLGRLITTSLCSWHDKHVPCAQLLQTFCLRWPQTIILPISASCTARITGVSHYAWSQNMCFISQTKSITQDFKICQQL
jgi:hypothetical protein